MTRYMRNVNPVSRASKRASRSLYTAARAANDLSAITSGDPARIGRRIKNRAIGRLIARSGIWR